MIRIARYVLWFLRKTGGIANGKKKEQKNYCEKNRLKGNTATANCKYKDTVFRMLFSDRRNLLSLYNAINETSYTDAAQLELPISESVPSKDL